MAGTEWPSRSTAGLLEPPPCARNTIPGPDDSRVYLKSVSMGKGENKKPAPATRGESKRPYWHTGGAALGLAGSNKMLSVPPHRRDQDGSAEGGATRLGTIGYRAKADACPGLAALDLKPTWPIYKFCFHWWQAGLPDRGRFGELPGATICSVPPLPSGNERD